MENNKVILGVTKTTSFIFDEEFPDLKKVNLEPYNIRYSKKMPLSLILLLDSMRISKVIKKEKEQLKMIIKEYQIDVVISDNRFGLHNANVESIYITHQLNIHAGVFSFCATKIHRHYIKKFNHVWVPDFEEEEKSLAGKLSRNSGLNNVVYLGPLSRLSFSDTVVEKFDFLCLLSGPEPLRTELELLLVNNAKHSGKRICIVRGTQSVHTGNLPENVTLMNMPKAADLSRLIQNSETVICRSGYSTLMDLHHLKKKSVILIPTPGQHEQLYLADYWKKKFDMRVVQQKDLPCFKF